MATMVELISIAIFTGLGSGFGSPIGQWFYKKYLEPRLDSAHNRVQIVSEKFRNGTIETPKVDTEDVINKMLGKQ